MQKFVIKNAQVCDGVSQNIINADILVENGRIADIAPNINIENIEIFDAKGMIAAPGFIDAHSHSEIRKLK